MYEQRHVSVWRDAPASSTKKTEIVEIVEALRGRAPWHAARPILEANEVPVGHGWDKTLEEISFHEFLPKANIDGLYEAYLQHASCGEKSVRFFDVGAINVQTLRDYFAAGTHPKRLLRPLTAAQLKMAKPTEPKLVCVSTDGPNVLGVFSSIAQREERIDISPEQLPESAQEMFSDYEKIIAIKVSFHQAYGIICVPSKGDRVEIRVDDMIGDNRKAIADHHQSMYVELHKNGGTKKVFSAVDVSKAIKNLYGAANEGTILELSFATTTGSLKTEKMRSRECLRMETFHVGGKAALRTDIEPYRVGVRWERTGSASRRVTHPELHLNGLVHLVSGTSAGLYDATIRRASDFSDYNWVRDKLLEYI